MSDTSPKGFFDRFAEWVDGFVSRPFYFVVCAVFILLWLIGLPFAGWDNDIYHLFLNSPTTAITFLLVAVAANAARRQSRADNIKLDAIARALASLMHDVGGEGHEDDIAELNRAMGIEETVEA